MSRPEAEREINRMKKSLVGWLEMRRKNDAAGDIAARDWSGEAELAAQLHGLLGEIYSPGSLPDPRVRGAAVQLAQIALAGKLLDHVEMAKPSPVGFIPLVVGGVVLLGFSSFIGSRADVQKHKETMACVARGECEDPGAWKKWAALAAVGAIGFFIYNKYGDSIFKKK